MTLDITSCSGEKLEKNYWRKRENSEKKWCCENMAVFFLLNSFRKSPAMIFPPNDPSILKI